MIKRRYLIAMSVLVVICVTAISHSAIRYAEAKRSSDAIERATGEMAEQASEILVLRSTQQRIELYPRPAQDLIARVNAVLSESGINQRRFKGLNPESDVAVPIPAPGSEQIIRRQTVRLTLQNLEPSELGEFLQLWKKNNPIWLPTRIDLTHSGSARSQDNRYDAVLLLSALYLGEQEPS